MTVTFFYVILTLGITMVFSFIPEYFLKPTPSDIVRKKSVRLITLQCLLVALLFLVVTLIVQRMVFASLAVIIFLIILSGVSNAKYLALREPLVYSDIAMFSQAFKHPRLYFPFLGLIPVILMPVIIIALITILLILEPAMAFTGQRVLLTLIASSLCFIVAKKIALPLSLNEDPAIDNRQYGLVNSIFAYTLQANSEEHKQQIKDTLNHSPFAIKQTENIVFSEVEVPVLSEVEVTPPTFLGVLPKKTHNITVIQSESFFDARRMHPSINKGVLDNYDACLKESIQFGQLKVPAWGANTMRTEFSFLTGLKYEEMGLYRYYPYQFLQKMPVVSLAKLLQAQGYHCVCIHPHPASFFGRDRIFPQMGFNEFIDIKSFDSKQTFGPYISDHAVTDKILEIQAKHKNKSLFIFAITMENHGPLHLEKTTQSEQQRYYSSKPFDDINDLTVYLRHLKNADTMVQRLTNAYAEIDTPTTLCFYGDHVPSMPKTYQSLAYEDRDSDYFIWNNKGTKNTSNKHTLAVDDLASFLLKQTGNIK